LKRIIKLNYLCSASLTVRSKWKANIWYRTYELSTNA